MLEEKKGRFPYCHRPAVPILSIRRTDHQTLPRLLMLQW